MKEKDAAGRRAQIQAAAVRLFAEQGYLAASARQIAEAAGLEPSSMYNYFRAKEDMLWEPALASAQAFDGAVRPIFESDREAQQKLHEMLEAHARVALERRELAPVYTQEWRHLAEPRRSEYAAMRDAYERMFRQAFARGVADGRLHDVDARIAVKASLGALNAAAFWYRPDGELAPEIVAQRLTHALLYGLVRRD